MYHGFINGVLINIEEVFFSDHLRMSSVQFFLKIGMAHYKILSNQL